MKDCNQCGKCCIKYGGGDLNVSQEEVDLWELFNPDIFAFVKNYQIWHDPKTGEKLTQCPFLTITPQNNPHAVNKYTCSIYLDRPEDCRHYPSLISEMVTDECEMIEISDLENYKKAQKKLDNLMQDSRKV
ncbi:YkgJ family cysteine cluster protein [Pseudoalteromonas shioyasakiensis]|uniref:YkgJ family cysteine cluster protein n=1 Tax=Pseudoalteromonas shioyasakiensis TaxID=1190813 RepID=UPI002117DAB3|nr:YkgJ family cysteine cluster protein [Pseudoalteromonas shioyasakiensis]MCQ8877167.1 YkgJ family cysteine cluster protein [Pseudoalteromonas shioyasakiensis]